MLTDWETEKPVYSRRRKDYSVIGRWLSSDGQTHLSAWGYGATKETAISDAYVQAVAKNELHEEAVAERLAREPKRLLLTEIVNRIVQDTGWKVSNRHLEYLSRFGHEYWNFWLDYADPTFPYHALPTHFWSMCEDWPFDIDPKSIDVVKCRQHLIDLYAFLKEYAALRSMPRLLREKYKENFPLRKVDENDVGKVLINSEGYGGTLIKFTPGYGNCHLSNPLPYHDTTRMSKKAAQGDWRVLTVEERDDVERQFREAQQNIDDFEKRHADNPFMINRHLPIK